MLKRKNSIFGICKSLKEFYNAYHPGFRKIIFNLKNHLFSIYTFGIKKYKI